MSRRSPRHDLDNWLDLHGYRYADARKQKAPHPYAESPRMDHATRRRESAPRPIKISSKDPASMTAAEINKELDKLDGQNSKLGQLMIDAGRGHERPSEYLHMHDPLALELQHNHERRTKLRIEIESRYGPGAPRRLPPGFGPLKNVHAAKAKPVSIVVAWTEDTQELAPGQKSCGTPESTCRHAFCGDHTVRPPRSCDSRSPQ